MRIYSISLTAGQSLQLNVSGEFIAVIEASSPFYCAPDGDDSAELESGLKWRPSQQFKTLTLKSDLTQSIKLAVGRGDFDDSRLVVSGGLKTQGKSADNANYGAVTVGTSAVLIKAANASRSTILIQNLSSVDLYVGANSAVTTASGFLIGSGGSAEMKTASDIYGIALSAGLDVRYFEEVNA